MDAFHERYCAALRELFEAHKASHGMASVALDFV